MAYKIHYSREFMDSNENGIFTNCEEYVLDGVYDTIEEAMNTLRNIGGEIFGALIAPPEGQLDPERHELWVSDPCYGDELWKIIEA